MKVTRDTRDQLIIADSPWLIGLSVVAFILIFVGIGISMVLQGEWFGLVLAVLGGGLGFGAFAAFVRRTQVIFDRPSDTVTLRTQTVFGYRQVQHELSNLSGVVLEASFGSGDSKTYRPTLMIGKGMSAGAHPITEVYTSGSGPARAVKAIHARLAQAP